VRKIDLYLLLKSRENTRTAPAKTARGVVSGLTTALLALISLVLVLSLFIFGYLFTSFSRDLPSIETLPALLDRERGELLTATRVVDRSGEVTLYTYEEPAAPRKFLSIDPQEQEFFSPQLVRAATAVYDPDFWSNPGYRLESGLNPEPQTIAEKLVSDLLLASEAPSPVRALRMRLLAGQVVSNFGRAKVIEWYLNSAWFGRYAYGAESAAQLYLGKSAMGLTLAESALLSTVLRSPALNPIDAPQTALEMQRDLLRDMLAQGIINREEYDLAVAEKIVIIGSPERADTFAEGFIRQVEKQLESELGTQRLQRGGLIVRTTLDANLQEQLVCAAASQLIRVQYSNVSGVAPGGLDCQADLLLPTQSFNGLSAEGLAAAGLIMDPPTGEVLAYLEPMTVTGERLRDTGYQPGTLLSPMVALSAFSRGYSPASLVWDIPSGSGTPGLEDELTYHGAVNLRGALANDYIVPIARLVDEIGADNVWNSAALVGVDALAVFPNSATPLFSGSETSLFQLATSYSTFANQGWRSGRLDAVSGAIVPETVLEITTTSGSIVRAHSIAQSTVIVSEPLAYMVNHVLSDESARWPSLGYPNALEVGQPVAAKVGSAGNHQQVWTVGYNANRLVLVWMGNRGTVGTELPEKVAAGLWHAVYTYVTRDTQFDGWAIPAGITETRVCSPSGMLPTVDCPLVVSDVFLFGNEPSATDTLYFTARVNRETGLLATVFTPPELVEERTYMNVPAEARAWAATAGIELAPQYYDAIQMQRVDPLVKISEPAIFSVVSGRVNILGTADIADFTSYQVQVGEGINPSAWQQLGSSATKAVEDGLLAVWETTGLDGLYAIRLNVVDSQRNIQTAIIQVTVDNTPPSGRITYPEDGSTVQPVRGGVTMNALVEDQVGIARVEWWVDGKSVLRQTSAPFVYQLDVVSGSHTVYLKIWDSAGNSTITEAVNFKIKP
jgi:membrane peptidoglycan carboxypeptidase